MGSIPPVEEIQKARSLFLDGKWDKGFHALKIPEFLKNYGFALAPPIQVGGMQDEIRALSGDGEKAGCCGVYRRKHS
jgi:hypothetical protein